MKNTIRNIFLIICLFFQYPGAMSDGYGQDTTAYSTPETPKPDLRDIDQSRIEDFKADEDFDYLEKSSPGLTIWDRFWRAVQRLLNYIFSATNPTTLGLILRYLIYILAIAAVGFAVYKLVLSRITFPTTTKDNSGNLELEISEENIHDLDFEDLISEALNNGNFRLAIRLRYLQSLKFLSDHDLIHWEPYKTNHEYSTEIDKPAIRASFDRISYYFDYAWYGEFVIEKKHYDRVGEIFNELRTAA